jgi:hypothetical protein
MLLFCDGMPRSATTWIFNVTFALVRKAFAAADIRRAVYVSSATFDLLGEGADWTILKCHRLDENARDLFRTGAARAIYTHRDIYDAMASYLVMFRIPFELAIESIKESLDVYDFHYQTGNYLCLDYESVIERPGQTVLAMAKFLEIDLPAPEIALIEQAHGLVAIKELTTKLNQVNGDRLIRDQLSCYDPNTQWHVRHVRNGGIGYGRRYLLPQQIEQIEDLIRNRQGPSRDLLRLPTAQV